MLVQMGGQEAVTWEAAVAVLLFGLVCKVGQAQIITRPFTVAVEAVVLVRLAMVAWVRVIPEALAVQLVVALVALVPHLLDMAVAAVLKVLIHSLPAAGEAAEMQGPMDLQDRQVQVALTVLLPLTTLRLIAFGEHHA